MWFGIISLFPEMFSAIEYGITGRALKSKLIEMQVWNPRDFTTDKHQTVDSTPYGGGPGMVMMPTPLQASIEAARQAAPTPPSVIFLTPQGRQLDQAGAAELAGRKSLILLAGRYEGIDERIIEATVDEEWSVGDYVLSGGELPAMVMIDSITRLLPGAVGDADSISEDSLINGLLKYPQYTRPDDFEGKTVPEVLKTGNHAAIRRWRLKQSLGRTWLKRPDLLEKRANSPEEMQLLDEFIKEFKEKR